VDGGIACAPLTSSSRAAINQAVAGAAAPDTAVMMMMATAEGRAALNAVSSV